MHAVINIAVAIRILLANLVSPSRSYIASPKLPEVEHWRLSATTTGAPDVSVHGIAMRRHLEPGLALRG